MARNANDTYSIERIFERMLKKALETLDCNEFIAEMPDDFMCGGSEKAEVKRQRADVIRQAKEKGLWRE